MTTFADETDQRDAVAQKKEAGQKPAPMHVPDAGTPKQGQAVGALSALSDTCVAMYVIDLKEHNLLAIKPDGRIAGPVSPRPSLQRSLAPLLDALSPLEDVRDARTFLRLSTLQRRMGEDDSVSELFLTEPFGWVLATFTRLGEGRLRHVLYVVESLKDHTAELDERERLLEENRELHGMVRALMDDYTTIVGVTPGTGEIEVFRIEGHVVGDLPIEKLPYPFLVALYVSRAVAREDRGEMIAALAPANLQELLTQGTGLTRTFRNVRGKSCEMRIVQTDDDSLLMGFRERSREVEELTELAYTDSLTRVKNRRHYDEFLAETPCRALVVVDADHFKEINDSQGHQCGDDALVAIAVALTSCVRPSDDVVRYGGDEFLIAFEEIDQDVLRKRLETMRAAIENTRLDRYPDLRLAISLGAAFSENAVPARELFALADKALYASKAQEQAVTVLTLEGQGGQAQTNTID